MPGPPAPPVAEILQSQCPSIFTLQSHSAHFSKAHHGRVAPTAASIVPPMFSPPNPTSSASSSRGHPSCLHRTTTDRALPISADDQVHQRDMHRSICTAHHLQGHDRLHMLARQGEPRTLPLMCRKCCLECGRAHFVAYGASASAHVGTQIGVTRGLPS